MANTALVLIDYQNDYFEGGRFTLPHAAQAVAQAARLLAHFRAQGLPVIHIQHIAAHDGATFFLPDTAGAAIHPSMAPREGERVIIKHKANAFVGTALHATLQELDVQQLVIGGMMTNMCVDAGVRAAADMGYACVLVADACAAANLAHDGVAVPAAQVHAAFVAALGFAYAQVVACGAYISGQHG